MFTAPSGPSTISCVLAAAAVSFVASLTDDVQRML